MHNFIQRCSAFFISKGFGSKFATVYGLLVFAKDVFAKSINNFLFVGGGFDDRMAQFININNFSTELFKFCGKCAFASARFAGDTNDDRFVFWYRQVDFGKLGFSRTISFLRRESD